MGGRSSGVAEQFRGFLSLTNGWRQKTHFSHFWGGGGTGPSKVRRLIADRGGNRRAVQIRLSCQIGLHADAPKDLVAIQRRQLDTQLQVEFQLFLEGTLGKGLGGENWYQGLHY